MENERNLIHSAVWGILRKNDIENLPENTIPSVKIALDFIKNKIPISEMRV